MGHKPRVAVRDPFPGLSGARLARRRLLALAGHLIDDLIVVTTSEREIAIAAARARRHDIEVLVHAPGLPGVAAARLAAIAGAAGVVLPAGDVVGVPAALDHGRVMVEATGPELAAVAHLDPRAERSAPVRAASAPARALRRRRRRRPAGPGRAGTRGLVGHSLRQRLAPARRRRRRHRRAAAALADAAAIWLDALLDGDRAGAIRRALAGRCSADAATVRCIAGRRRPRAGRRVPVFRTR